MPRQGPPTRSAGPVRRPAQSRPGRQPFPHVTTGTAWPDSDGRADMTRQAGFPLNETRQALGRSGHHSGRNTTPKSI